MAVAITVSPAGAPANPNTVTVTGLVDTAVIFKRYYTPAAGGSAVYEPIPGQYVVAAGAVTYKDYLYPLDTPVSYVVYKSDGVTPLATSTPAPAVASGGKPWIRDVMFPALRYSDVRIIDLPSRLRAGRVAVNYVIADPYAFTVGDVRSAPSGTLQLYCTGHTERDRVLNVLSTGNPVQLRIPVACQTMFDEMLFTPLDVTETRWGGSGACILSVDYVETGWTQVAPFQPVTYAAQTQNAATAGLKYGSLGPPATGLAAAFVGKTYVDMYLSPTGIAP
jgi:hypothetical protein